jgi:hypothetical protein
MPEPRDGRRRGRGDAAAAGALTGSGAVESRSVEGSGLRDLVDRLRRHLDKSKWHVVLRAA